MQRLQIGCELGAHFRHRVFAGAEIRRVDRLREVRRVARAGRVHRGVQRTADVELCAQALGQQRDVIALRVQRDRDRIAWAVTERSRCIRGESGAGEMQCGEVGAMGIARCRERERGERIAADDPVAHRCVRGERRRGERSRRVGRTVYDAQDWERHAGRRVCGKRAAVVRIAQRIARGQRDVAGERNRTVIALHAAVCVHGMPGALPRRGEVADVEAPVARIGDQHVAARR